MFDHFVGLDGFGMAWMLNCFGESWILFLMPMEGVSMQQCSMDWSWHRNKYIDLEYIHQSIRKTTMLIDFLDIAWRSVPGYSYASLMASFLSAPSNLSHCMPDCLHQSQHRHSLSF